MSGHEHEPGSSDAGTAEVLAGLNGLRGDIAGYAGETAKARREVGEIRADVRALATAMDTHARHDDERHADNRERLCALEAARIKAAEGGEARGVQSGRVSERVAFLFAVGSVVATLAAKTVWDAVTTPAPPPESANVAR